MFCVCWEWIHINQKKMIHQFIMLLVYFFVEFRPSQGSTNLSLNSKWDTIYCHHKHTHTDVITLWRIRGSKKHHSAAIDNNIQDKQHSIASLLSKSKNQLGRDTIREGRFCHNFDRHRNLAPHFHPVCPMVTAWGQKAIFSASVWLCARIWEREK